ncbi:MAG: methyltransferase domain-containing protein [Magnetospirillum sp.]|nr:methyltransferase domain-containing protein [Magnetospirillum sp.]
MTRKQKVAAAFAAAATTYDSAAEAQAKAADRLVELVTAEPLPAHPTVLEVGCGTGLLTRRLLPRIGGDWLVTDLSPAMVAAAQAAVGADKAQFRVMDGEHPDAPLGLYDLVVSNMAAQWFADMARAVCQLRARLAPGGRLVLSTLGAGSFAEWRAAHQALGLTCGTPAYPSADALAAQLPGGARVREETVTVRHDDALAFLTALKRIGADTPASGHTPLSPGALRRVARAMGSPVSITYDILYALIPAE